MATNKNTIPVLQRAIQVLREVAAGGHTNTKALAQQTGVPHTTVYRILRTFEEADWIEPDGDGGHALSFGLMPLLQPLSRHELLSGIVRPQLQGLAQKTGLAAKLSVRQGGRAVTLARAESPRETAVAVRVGASFPLVLGSSGAVLLSDLAPADLAEFLKRAPADCWSYQARKDVERRVAECRKKGVCHDSGSYRPDVCTVSAPIRDKAGAVVGALTLIGFASDFAKDADRGHARALLAAAKVCTENLCATRG